MSVSSDRRPASQQPRDLGFERQKMVNWYDPGQLLKTIVKVLLSAAFGSYADKRELMPVLASREDESALPFHDYSEREDIWLDYTADLGDGWDSTYAVASLLARAEIDIGREILPRGKLLILGGDEVYPTATRDEYKNRTTGPYQAALPWVRDEDQAPHLYAIPGNHDWYDGLTSFLRQFCQQRWIGGWRTRQSRSYFAIKLPHNWWLWGLDVQLESDLDDPQKAYFSRIAAEHMQAGDKVILCTAEPSWVYAQLGDDKAQRNLEYVERKIIQEQGHSKVAVTIAGDLHHYCRYQGEDGETQKITSGGGGAFLHGTHNLPQTLDKQSQGEAQSFERRGVYPEPEISRGLLYRNLGFPLLNRSFSLFLGLAYLLYAWLMQSSSTKFGSECLNGSLLSTLAHPSPSCSLMETLGVVHLHSPVSTLVALLFLVGMIFFIEASPQQRPWRILMGLVHGAAHIALVIVATSIFARLNLVQLGMAEDSLSQVLLFAAEMLLTGFLLGGLLMGVHLIISNRWLAMNRTNAMSSLQIADYKNFLRMHLSAEGLRIMPIAVERAPTKWRFNGDGPEGSAWFEAADGEIPIRLVEKDILVPNPK